MFKNLFKPKWQSAKPQVRIQALQHLHADAAEDLHIIELMAKGDLDPEVRLAAIGRIHQRDKLLNLIQQEKDSKVRFGAIEHLVAQLNRQNNEADPEVRAMLAQLDSHALAAIVVQTVDADLGCLALAQLEDESLLEGYAVRLPLAQMRQSAAERLRSEDALERVIRASKGKDKSVWRICKEKLNALREEQQQEASIEQQIGELCHSLEQLSRLPYDNLYGPKLEHLQKQWQRLQHHADNEATQRFNRVYALCRAIVDDVHNEQDRMAEETRRQREALQERMAACEQLEEAVRQFSSTSVVAPTDIPALQALLNTQKTRWEEAASVVEPASDERKRFTRIHGLLQRALDAVRLLGEREPRIRSAAEAMLAMEEVTFSALEQRQRALEKALGDLRWPEELAWPDTLKLYQQALDHGERLRQKAKTLEEDALNNIRDLVNELTTEIDQGHLKPASRLLKEAQQLVRHLPMKVASGYQKKLREQTVRLNELRDWQGFVATPKKEELIQEMESLVGTDMDPQALAGRVQRLQDEWRSLGEADRGRNKELWERFRAAADQAYEPCRDYFDKLAQVRQSNLEQRRQICRQLETYLQQYDWDHADWKAVNEVYETAKREWRVYAPVERKAGRKVQEQFNGLLEQLRQRLQGEFERNRARREALIAAVEALQEHEELEHAIAETKTLQRQWREVGLVARRDDARLWKRFRAACDQVFARREQKREVQQKQREQNLEQAEHLIEQLEQLADSDMTDPDGARAEYQQLCRRVGELGPLPREPQTSLQDSFRRVCQLCEQALAQAEAVLRRDSLHELWRRAAICDELEEAWETGQPAPDLAGLEAEWDSNQPLPDAAEGPLQARFERALTAIQERQGFPGPEAERNAASLQELCLRLEIAAAVESPVEEQQQRMAVQVNRLNDGLNQRGEKVTPEQQLERLQLEWVAVGPVQRDARHRFAGRFQAVLKAAQ